MLCSIKHLSCVHLQNVNAKRFKSDLLVSPSNHAWMSTYLAAKVIWTLKKIRFFFVHLIFCAPLKKLGLNLLYICNSVRYISDVKYMNVMTFFVLTQERSWTKPNETLALGP